MSNNHCSRVSWFSDQQIDGIPIPERFTFPFCYEPHPLTQIAATELQHYLESQTELDHNFGLNNSREGMAIGKMFGVLVVQNAQGRTGYLSAFSGKLAGTNDHSRFVPPVFDMLTRNSFFLNDEEIINSLNARIDAVEADSDFLKIKLELKKASAQSNQELTAFKQALRANKEVRKQIREQQQPILSRQDYEVLEADLIKQSLSDKYQLKQLTRKWDLLFRELQTKLSQFEHTIESLKTERRERSAALQQKLFDQYAFLNKDGKRKSLQDIFNQTVFGKPPAAAGECATPKLLQFAFQNGYTPIAMAEFWWGTSPKSEIRKHKQFYPACTGKCKPILAHMLEGMPIDDNPLLQPTAQNSELEIIYEDDCFVVVNKPAGLRSVPGVDIMDSVYTRLKHVLANTEPLMIHRLDMDTSGLLVIAKTAQAHKHIQRQFLQRTVSKRYSALLSKPIDTATGEIDLPLCADPFNRPRQLVCFETGKKSITRWKKINTDKGFTKIHFWPLTGRTHQLRMHAAHELGLNAPIVGDDLYGSAGKRMYLHAAYLEFTHPTTKERISFEVEEEF